MGKRHEQLVRPKLESWEFNLGEQSCRGSWDASPEHKLLQGLQSSRQLALAGKSSGPEETEWLWAFRKSVVGESMQCPVISFNLSIFYL